MTDGKSTVGSSRVILQGKNLNIDCSIKFSNDIKLDEVVMRIDLTYHADFFGLLSLSRHPEPTLFTWFLGASNPQWVKGEFARP